MYLLLREDEILFFSQIYDVQSIMNLKKGIRFWIVDGLDKVVQLTALGADSKANRQFFFRSQMKIPHPPPPAGYQNLFGRIRPFMKVALKVLVSPDNAFTWLRKQFSRVRWPV